jgi:hypothetical protein
VRRILHEKASSFLGGHSIINDDDRYSDSGNYAIDGEEYLVVRNCMEYIMLSKYRS